MTTQPAPGPTDPNALVGQVIDERYRVDAYLSGGGMGDVYRAEQVSLARKVAIKVLRRDAAVRAADMGDRFTQEALALSKLDHPNIVRVIDFAQTEGRAYLVMEFADGPTLERALKQGQLEPKRAVGLLAQLCDALSAAHALGIVHRDLKPDNVVLTGPEHGVPKILDFGIARIAHTAGNTQAGMVLGTPEYISPEQALGQPAEPRSDLYALAVIAYRMLTGRLPLRAETPRELLVAHVSAPVPPLESVYPPLAGFPALCAAVMRGLAKEPAQRFADAQEMKEALLAGLGAPTGLTPPPQAPTGATGNDSQRLTAAVPSLRAAGARTQNLAIMFTDIKGFSERTSRQTREQNARLLAVHDALLLPVIRGFNGKKVKSIGDALLVTFQSPTDSVLCGMAIQDRLFAFNKTAPPDDIVEVRIAVSLGEVRVDAGDVFGEPVNIASRVQAIGEAGQVLFADAVYLAMNKSEVPTEEAGTFALKGIPDPVKVWRVQRRVVAEGELPYGGRALESLGPLPDALAAGEAALKGVSGRMYARLATLRLRWRRYRWRILGAAALVAVAGGGGFYAWRELRDPVARAERLLDDKQPLAALGELDRVKGFRDEKGVEDKARRAEAAVLRARAYHALGQLGRAFDAFAVAYGLDPSVVTEEMVRDLVDELDALAFPTEKRGALVKLLGDVGKPAEPGVRGLLASARAATRADALEALERMGRATDEDRLLVAQTDFADKTVGCEQLDSDVQRLASVGDERAEKLLKDVADARKCVRVKAQDALRRIERARSEKK